MKESILCSVCASMREYCLYHVSSCVTEELKETMTTEE